jgi:hypothetical protein
VLDGQDVFEPGAVQFIGDNGIYSNARSLERVATKVPAGSHVVRFQYPSFNGGGVHIVTRTAMADYR